MKTTSTAHSKTKSAPAATATTTATTTSPEAEAAPGTAAKDEFVRQAAYCYYEARGRIGGHELDDWLKAEAEFERLSRP
jgi:Protein of unknown function (DUF2934)